MTLPLQVEFRENVVVATKRAGNSKRFGAAHNQLRSRPEIRAGEGAGRQGGSSMRASPSRQMIDRR
jgi:hypothetical protein